MAMQPHLEAHDLERVEHEPRGEAELCALCAVVVVLGLVVHVLRQEAHLVVVEALRRVGRKGQELLTNISRNLLPNSIESILV